MRGGKVVMGRQGGGKLRVRLRCIVAACIAAACAPPSPAGVAVQGPPDLDTQLEIGAPLEAQLRKRSPVEMRARDGSVFPLRVLEVRGEVEGPLAFTELHLEFENADPRAHEAVLEMVLPTRARLSRFAIERDGVWGDAGVVPRDAVPRRESLHAKTPPAVDYGDQGQLFRVVVPQLPGRSRTRVVVAYRELLAGSGEPYRVHLQGMPQLERFSARVRGALGADRGPAPKEGAVGSDGIEIVHQNYRPVADLILRSPEQRTVAVQRDGLVVARIRPLTHDHHEALESLTVLFDTSASRAPGFEHSIERLSSTLEELKRWTGSDTRVHIVAFDQSHETVYEGPLSELADTDFERLRTRKALGASDLGAALRFLRRRPGHRYDRLLLVTDGVVTAGTRDLDRLSQTIRSLGEVGLRRLDVLEDGGLRDRSTLRRLTRVLPHPGMVLDPREGDRGLVRRLLRSVVTDVQIEVPDARWVYPGVVEGVQAGDELIVFAEFGQPLTGATLRIKVSGEIAAEHVIEWQPTALPLLATAIAEAHVDDLSVALHDSRDQPKAVRAKAYRKIVELSREHRLLNDYTRFTMADASLGASSAGRGPQLAAGIAGSGAAPGVDAVAPAPAPATLVMGPRHAEARSPAALQQAQKAARFPRRYLTVDRLALVLQLDEAAMHGVSTPPRDRVDAGTAAAALDLPAGIALAAKVAGGPGTVEAASREPVDFVADLRHDLQRETQRRFGGDTPQGLDALPITSRTHWSTWGRGRSTQSTAATHLPVDAHEGNLLAVMNLLSWGELAQAQRFAEAWRDRDPADPLAIVALGEAFEAQSAPDAATRAYGSLIDLYPDRPDVRRFAGTRLEGLSSAADDLAIDTFRRALDQDPDSPASHRSLALALLRRGRFGRAFDVLEAGLSRRFDTARHGHAAEGLRDDLGLIGAAWARKEPALRQSIEARLGAVEAQFPTGPSIRVSLSWETPDSDADLHVRDGAGHHAYHDSPRLPGGGHLVEDVTAGFGVERFVDEATETPETYDLQLHYFSRGPLGYGMGVVEILEHDGQGRLTFELRPFVVSRDRAHLDLGVWPNPPMPAVVPAR